MLIIISFWLIYKDLTYLYFSQIFASDSKRSFVKCLISGSVLTLSAHLVFYLMENQSVSAICTGLSVGLTILSSRHLRSWGLDEIWSMYLRLTLLATCLTDPFLSIALFKAVTLCMGFSFLTASISKVENSMWQKGYALQNFVVQKPRISLNYAAGTAEKIRSARSPLLTLLNWSVIVSQGVVGAFLLATAAIPIWAGIPLLLFGIMLTTYFVFGQLPISMLMLILTIVDANLDMGVASYLFPVILALGLASIYYFVYERGYWGAKPRKPSNQAEAVIEKSLAFMRLLSRLLFGYIPHNVFGDYHLTTTFSAKYETISTVKSTFALRRINPFRETGNAKFLSYILIPSYIAAFNSRIVEACRSQIVSKQTNALLMDIRRFVFGSKMQKSDGLKVSLMCAYSREKKWEHVMVVSAEGAELCTYDQTIFENIVPKTWSPQSLIMRDVQTPNEVGKDTN